MAKKSHVGSKNPPRASKVRKGVNPTGRPKDIFRLELPEVSEDMDANEARRVTENRGVLKFLTAIALGGERPGRVAARLFKLAKRIDREFPPDGPWGRDDRALFAEFVARVALELERDRGSVARQPGREVDRG